MWLLSSHLRAASIVLALTLLQPAFAQDVSIHPIPTPPEPGALPLDTGPVQGQTAAESWFRQWGEPMVRNVSTATLTPVLPPPGRATGAAVIVAPGGAFRWLSMNNEGWKVARALADQGVAAFVLKYRLQPTPADVAGFRDAMARSFAAAGSTPGDGQPPPPLPAMDLPLADAQAAHALILARAKEWGIDPDRLGMIGFSAGAALTLQSVLRPQPLKLAFIAPIYGGMGPVQVPANAPPMFNVIATDDFLFRGQFGVVKSWFEAGRPVEFHLYQNGGHGFGLGYPGNTANGWFPVFMRWLDVNGWLKPRAPAPAIR